MPQARRYLLRRTLGLSECTDSFWCESTVPPRTTGSEAKHAGRAPPLTPASSTVVKKVRPLANLVSIIVIAPSEDAEPLWPRHAEQSTVSVTTAVTFPTALQIRRRCFCGEPGIASQRDAQSGALRSACEPDQHAPRGGARELNELARAKLIGKRGNDLIIYDTAMLESMVEAATDELRN